MKKLLLLCFISFGFCCLTYAQQPMPATTSASTDNVTRQDYAHMLEAQLQVDFRKYAIENLGLDEKQIIAFDPIFREYMNAKDKIVERKFDVLKNYAKEADEHEDASMAKKDDDMGDAIEDYWEAEIADMELQKDYFDRLEDVITTKKAFNFFLLEDAVMSRLKAQSVAEFIPIIVEIEKMPKSEYGNNIPGNMNEDQNQKNMSQNDRMKENNNQMSNNNTQMNNNTSTNRSDMNAGKMTNKDATRMNYDRSNIDAFSTWYTNNGKMTKTENSDLSHQNIYEGLTKLTAAIETFTSANNMGTSSSDWTTKKDKIMTLADGLRQNPMSTQHADKAREAFIMIADCLKMVPAKTASTSTRNAVDEVATAARNLKAGQLLTKQTEAVNNFFSKAQQAVNTLSKDTTWMEKK